MPSTLNSPPPLPPKLEVAVVRLARLAPYVSDVLARDEADDGPAPPRGLPPRPPREPLPPRDPGPDEGAVNERVDGPASPPGAGKGFENAGGPELDSAMGGSGAAVDEA